MTPYFHLLKRIIPSIDNNNPVLSEEELRTLLELGLLINSPLTPEGITLLEALVSLNMPGLDVTHLCIIALNNHASPDIVGSQGYTPLQIACRNLDNEKMILMLKYSKNPMLSGLHGLSPLAILYEFEIKNDDALGLNELVAILHIQDSMIGHLVDQIIEVGVDIIDLNEMGIYHLTALGVARAYYREEDVEYLIKNGATAYGAYQSDDTSWYYVGILGDNTAFLPDSDVFLLIPVQ